MHADCNSRLVHRFGKRKQVGPVQPSEKMLAQLGVDASHEEPARRVGDHRQG
jgi:hypothetical protein